MKKETKEEMHPDILGNFDFEELKGHAIEMANVELRSENLFLHAIISQIEAACDAAENNYNKDLKNMIRIILSPFVSTDDEPEEEKENAE